MKHFAFRNATEKWDKMGKWIARLCAPCPIREQLEIDPELAQQAVECVRDGQTEVERRVRVPRSLRRFQ